MAQHIIYKPYKKSLKTWNNMKDKTREEPMGRKILNIEIGKKVYVDEDTGIIKSEESICEDIYIDILRGVMTGGSIYKTVTTPASEPCMVISCDGRLVIHNDKISSYFDKIISFFEHADKYTMAEALTEYVINESIQEKFGPSLKKLTSDINKKYNSKFPPELVAMVLKEYILEDFREEQESSSEENEFRYMAYEDLMRYATESLKDILLGKKNKNEDFLKDELFYRFITGNLISKNG